MVGGKNHQYHAHEEAQLYYGKYSILDLGFHQSYRSSAQTRPGCDKIPLVPAVQTPISTPNYAAFNNASEVSPDLCSNPGPASHCCTVDLFLEPSSGLI